MRERAILTYEDLGPGRKPRKKWKADPGGQGSQIVREALVCQTCFDTKHSHEVGAT